MRVRDAAARLVLLVKIVVDEAEDGLDDEQSNDDGAEDSVGFALVLVQLGEVSNCLMEKIERNTRSVICASLMPSPKPTIRDSSDRTCRAACRIGEPMRRMDMAPRGNSRVTVTPMMVP